MSISGCIWKSGYYRKAKPLIYSQYSQQWNLLHSGSKPLGTKRVTGFGNSSKIHTSHSCLLPQWPTVKVSSWMAMEEMVRTKKESVQESKLEKGFSLKLTDCLIVLKPTVWCIFSLILWFCLACDKITLLQMQGSDWQQGITVYSISASRSQQPPDSSQLHLGLTC